MNVFHSLQLRRDGELVLAVKLPPNVPTILWEVKTVSWSAQAKEKLTVAGVNTTKCIFVFYPWCAQKQKQYKVIVLEAHWNNIGLTVWHTQVRLLLDIGSTRLMTSSVHFAEFSCTFANYGSAFLQLNIKIANIVNVPSRILKGHL